MAAQLQLPPLTKCQHKTLNHARERSMRTMTGKHLMTQSRGASALFLATVICCALVTWVIVRAQHGVRLLVGLNDQRHDFGVVRAGSTLEHVFRLTNPSNVPITIDNVTSGCGCTVAQLPQHDLEPQGSVEVPVSVHVPDDDREYEVITAISYKGTNAITKLVVRFRSIRELPTVVDLGRFRMGESREATFAFRPADPTIQLLDMKYDDRVLEVRRNAEVQNKGVVKLTVRAKPGLTPGIIDQTLLLDDTNHAARSVRVTGYIWRPVESRDAEILLGSSADNGEVRLFSPYGRAFRVESVTSAPDYFESDLRGIHVVNGDTVVPIRLRTAAGSGVLRGTITISGAIGQDRFEISLDGYALGAARMKS